MKIPWKSINREVAQLAWHLIGYPLGFEDRIRISGVRWAEVDRHDGKWNVVSGTRAEAQ